MSLSREDRASLRRMLESKRAALLRAHGENLDSGTHAEETNVRDPMDEAERAEEEAERLGLADLERGTLGEIDRALAKLDAGTYGVSELSGEPIPIGRLRAVPWARFTTEEEEERRRG